MRQAGEALSRLILSGMTQGVVVSTRAGGMLLSNEPAERILGLTRRQLESGEPPPAGWALCLADGLTPIAEHPAHEVMRTGEAIEGRDLVVIHGDGRRGDIRMSVHPLHAADGSTDGVVMTVTDVTDEHHTRQRELDEARLHSLDARSNEIEIIVALDGSIVHGNDHARAAYGYSREEFAELSIQDLRDAATAPNVGPQMHQANVTGARFETIHRRKDGSTFPVEVSSRGFTVGNERYLHSLVRDLTEPRREEAERRKLEQLAEAAHRDRDAILTHSPVGILKVRDRHTVWMNPRMVELTGYTLEELHDTSTRVFYPSDEAWARVGRTAYPIMAAGGAFVEELELVHKDGTAYTGRLSGRAADPAEPLGESIWTLEDVTQTREAERRLLESEDRMRSIVTAMAEGIVVQDTAGVILMCNAAAERILGLTRDQMEGRSSVDPRWRSVHEDGTPFPGETHPSMVTLRTGQPQEGVVMGVSTPDGDERWISISSEPLRSAPDQPPHAVVATFTDITELRRGQAALAAGERRYRRLFESYPDGVVVFEVMRDEQGRAIDWQLREANLIGRRLFGTGYPFAVGRPATELLGEDQIQPFIDATESILTGLEYTGDIVVGRSALTIRGTVFAMDDGTLVAVAKDVRSQAGTPEE